MKRRGLVSAGLAVGLLLLTGCLGSRPRAEFTADPGSGYPPLEVHFDARTSHSPNGIISSYDWDFDDGETATGKTVVHTFAEKGIYKVSLTVTDSAGAIGTVYHNIQALSLPPHPEFTIYPTPATMFFPTEFDASGSYDPDGMIVEYVWAFGDGETDEGVFVQHLYAEGGGRWYTVRLTVIDDDGVSVSTEKRLQVLGCATCGAG